MKIISYLLKARITYLLFSKFVYTALKNIEQMAYYNAQFFRKPVQCLMITGNTFMHMTSV